MEPLDKIYLIPRKGQDRREIWWLAYPPKSGEFETYINATMIPESSIEVRVRVLRDAAASVCAFCAKGVDVSKKIYYDGTFEYIHLGMGSGWTECEAAGINQLIEQAEAEEREAGDAAGDDLVAAIGRIESWIAAAKERQS